MTKRYRGCSEQAGKSTADKVEVGHFIGVSFSDIFTEPLSLRVKQCTVTLFSVFVYLAMACAYKTSGTGKSFTEPSNAGEEVNVSNCVKNHSYYNIFTVQGTAASRVFFRIVAKAVRMRESWPDVSLQGLTRPQTSLSASLSFAAFDLCRLSHFLGAPVSSNRLDRQWWNGWSPKQIHDEERSI